MTTLKFFNPVVARSFNNEVSDWANVLDRFFENDNRLDRSHGYPKTNILEFEDSYRIDMYLPGIAKEDVSIEIENNELIISKEKEQPADENTYRLREFSSRNFRRVFSLSDDIDTSQPEAKMENGILSVVLRKREEAKPVKRAIEIQ